jgi:hypothetical protein
MNGWGAASLLSICGWEVADAPVSGLQVTEGRDLRISLMIFRHN